MTPGAILDRIARVTPKRSESKAPLRFLPHPIRGLIAFSLLSLNTVAGSMAILPLALVKLVVPIPAVRKRIDPMLNAIVEWWIEGNGRWISLMQDVQWEVEGVEQLRPDGWYLVVANHQSWADVFVLQKVLNRRIPLVKFTLKRVLIWVPFAGLAWWALDFPFMSRHSEEFLRRNPERRGEDLAAIRRRVRSTSLSRLLSETSWRAPDLHLRNTRRGEPTIDIFFAHVQGGSLSLSTRWASNSKP